METQHKKTCTILYKGKQHRHYALVCHPLKAYRLSCSGYLYEFLVDRSLVKKLVEEQLWRPIGGKIVS